MTKTQIRYGGSGCSCGTKHTATSAPKPPPPPKPLKLINVFDYRYWILVAVLCGVSAVLA